VSKSYVGRNSIERMALGSERMSATVTQRPWAGLLLWVETGSSSNIPHQIREVARRRHVHGESLTGHCQELQREPHDEYARRGCRRAVTIAPELMRFLISAGFVCTQRSMSSCASHRNPGGDVKNGGRCDLSRTGKSTFCNHAVKNLRSTSVPTAIT
jgi:hypothetical protein